MTPSFLQLVTPVEAEPLPRSLLSDIVEGRSDGLLVPGFLSPSAAAQSLSTLERILPELERFAWPGPFRTETVGGPVLDLADGLEAAYAEHAASARDLRDRVFGAPDIVDRVRELLARCSGDLPVHELDALGGERFVGATIRATHPGGFIPPHCDREQLLRPASRAARAVLDPDVVLAFIVYLGGGESGGGLRVYDLRWDQLGPEHFQGEGRLDPRVVSARHDFVLLTPPAGSLLVFDAGRFVHEVEPVTGDTTRWTLGGFVGMDRGRSSYCLWN